MNNELIAFGRAPSHSHALNPAVRNCHCYNLRAKRWERRKTDCLELNLFATQEAFAQITQGKAEPKPGKGPARFNINPFGHILMILADVRWRFQSESPQRIHAATFRVSILSRTIFPESVLVVVEIVSVPHTPRRRKICK